MRFQPTGAILDTDDLKVIIILGLSVWIWDVDMNQVFDDTPVSIKQGSKGALISFKMGEDQYMKWFGIEDPTYNATEVLWSLPDDQISKAEAEYASMYMFNTSEEANGARDEYRKFTKTQYLKRTGQKDLS